MAILAIERGVRFGCSPPHFEPGKWECERTLIHRNRQHRCLPMKSEKREEDKGEGGDGYDT